MAMTRTTISFTREGMQMIQEAAQLRAIGDQGYALAEKAMKVAEEEADRKQ